MISDELQHGEDLAALRERETEMAVSDAACYRQVGLGPLRRAAMARARAAVERENRPLLEELVAFQAQAVERAEEGARP